MKRTPVLIGVLFFVLGLAVWVSGCGRTSDLSETPSSPQASASAKPPADQTPQPNPTGETEQASNQSNARLPAQPEPDKILGDSAERPAQPTPGKVSGGSVTPPAQATPDRSSGTGPASSDQSGNSPGTGDSVAAGAPPSGQVSPSTPGEASETGGESKSDPTKAYLRSNSGGSVEVDVLWVAPEYAVAAGNPVKQYDPEKSLVFYVGMTTHSEDLLSYDMLQGAVLRAGDLEIAPQEWQYIKEDAHHPDGVLVFPRQTPDGNVFPPAGATTLTLILKNLNDVAERVFTWDMP